MKTIIKAAAATLVFGAVHSALASRRAKRIAAGLVGSERSEATYRVFYVGQGLITFGALTAYCLSLPKLTVYRVHGQRALLLRTGQIAGLIQLLAGLREVGLKCWSGMDKLHAWQRGEATPIAPIAQGPELRKDSSLTFGGPFRWSRHPLNFAAVPLFWLTPHMTTRRLAFNVVGTAYLMLGSVHEEVRLRAVYGEKYERYLKSRVPFFVPALRPRLPSHRQAKDVKSVESGRR